MQTIAIQLYEYSDLIKPENEHIKDLVISKYAETTLKYNDFHWISEIKESYKEFEESLPYPPENKDMTGNRLRTWIVNNFLPTIESPKYYFAARRENGTIARKSNLQTWIDCPYTGTTYDHNTFQPILDFIKSPNDCDTWEDLVNECSNSIHRTIENEVEWQLSEEYIMDAIECNGYTFTENGDMY